MYDVMLSEYRQSNRQVDVEVAVGFFFRHCFMVGGIDEEISGVVQINLEKFLRKDFTKLEAYHNRIKCCELLNQEGQYLVSDRGLNTSSAIFYFDPPYSATKGYEVYFGKKEMKTLISGFKKIKGNFIYSCVAGVSSSKTRNYIENNDFDYDALEGIAYLDNGDQKFIKTRNDIAEMFSLFLDVCKEKQLYVIFSGFSSVSAIEMLKTCVSYNIKLEVMITDIDFDIDVINKNSLFARIFHKMDFLDFYNIVRPILVS